MYSRIPYGSVYYWKCRTTVIHPSGDVLVYSDVARNKSDAFYQCKLKILSSAYFSEPLPRVTTLSDLVPKKYELEPECEPFVIDLSDDTDNDDDEWWDENVYSLVPTFNQLVLENYSFSPEMEDGNADSSGVGDVNIDASENTMITTAAAIESTAVVDENCVEEEDLTAFIDGGKHYFPKLTSRWMDVTSIQWQTTDTGIIAALHMPQFLFQGNAQSPNLIPFKTYFYSQPHMTHEILVNSTSFHNGTLVVGIRYNTDPNAGVVIDKPSQLTSMNHVFVQASSANSVRIPVPFFSPSHYLSTKSTQILTPNYYHTLYIGVINRLSVGDGGSNTVSIRIKTKFETDSSQTAFAIQKAFEPEIFEFITNTVSNIIGGAEKMYSGAKQIWRAIDMDRPTLPLDKEQVIIQSVPDMSLGNGVIHLSSMRLSKDALCPFPPSLSYNSDSQCTIDYLKTIKNPFARFSWSVNDNSNIVKFTTPLLPIYKLFETEKLTTLSNIANFFTYYSGNLDFTFLFGSSLIHSGRLGVAFVPDTDDVKSPYDYPHLIFDLSTSQSFTVTAPNFSPNHLTPMFDRELGGHSAEAYAFGYMIVFVETPLKFIPSLSSTIDCTIFVSGNENFKLYVPSNCALDAEIEEERTEIKQNLTPLSIHDSTEHTIGEKFDLLPLCRRFNFVTKFTIPETQSMAFPVYALDDESQKDLIALLATGFRFSKGGYRYLIQVLSDDVVSDVHISFEPFKSNNSLGPVSFTPRLTRGDPSQLVISSVNRSIVVEIPYYSMYKYIANDPQRAINPLSNMISSPGNLIISNTGKSVDVAVYRAISDDFSFLMYQGFGANIESFNVNNVNKPLPPNINQIIYQGVDWKTCPTDKTGEAANWTAISSGSSHVKGNSYQIGAITPFVSPTYDVIAEFSPGVYYGTSQFAYQGTMPISDLPPLNGEPIKHTSLTVSGWIAYKPMSESGPISFTERKKAPPPAPDAASNHFQTRNIFVSFSTLVGQPPDDVAVSSTQPIIFNCYIAPIVMTYGTSGLITIPARGYVNITTDLYGDLAFIKGTPEVKIPRMIECVDPPDQVDDSDLEPECSDFRSESPMPVGVLSLDELLNECKKEISSFKKIKCKNVDPKCVMRKFNNKVNYINKCMMFCEPEIISSITAPFRNFNNILSNLSNVTDNLNDAIVDNPDVLTNLNQAAQNVTTLSNNVNSANIIGNVSNITENISAAVEENPDMLSNLNQAAQNVNTLSNNVNTVTSYASRFSKKISDCFSSILSIITSSTNNAWEWLANAIDVCMKKCADVFKINNVSRFLISSLDLGINLFNLLYGSSWTLKILSCVSLFNQVGIIDLRKFKVANVVQMVVNFFKTNNSNFNIDSPVSDSSTLEGEVLFSDPVMQSTYNWATFLLPALCAAFSFPSDYARRGLTTLLPTVSNLFRCSTNITLFFEKNCDLIKQFIGWMINHELPSISAIAALEDKKEEMTKWARAVFDITQGHMRSAVDSSTGMQRHLDLLYKEGQTYLALLHTRGVNANAFIQIMRKLADLHHAVGQRVASGMLVREPLRLWLYGGAGCGKSHVATHIACKLLVRRGIVYDGNFVYTRNYTEYWNGWADQPCVLYDDFGQNTSPERISQMIDEWFSLCSIAEFNAPMPAIEDKNRMVNPELIMLCSNDGYPRYNSVLSHEAFWRRRDAVIDCRLKPEYTSAGIRNCDDPRLPREVLASYSHMEFQVMHPLKNEVLKTWMPINDLMDYLYGEADRLQTRRDQASVSIQATGQALSPIVWQTRLEQRLESLPAEVISRVQDRLRNPINNAMPIPNVNPVILNSESPPLTTPPSENDAECMMCDVNADVPTTNFLPRDPIVYVDSPSLPERTPFPLITNDGCFCEYIIENGVYCPGHHAYCLYPADNGPGAAVNAAHIPEDRHNLRQNPIVEGSADNHWLMIGLTDYCSDACIGQSVLSRFRRWYARQQEINPILPPVVQDIMDSVALFKYGKYLTATLSRDDWNPGLPEIQYGMMFSSRVPCDSDVADTLFENYPEWDEAREVYSNYVSPTTQFWNANPSAEDTWWKWLTNHKLDVLFITLTVIQCVLILYLVIFKVSVFVNNLRSYCVSDSVFKRAFRAMCAAWETDPFVRTPKIFAEMISSGDVRTHSQRTRQATVVGQAGDTIPRFGDKSSLLGVQSNVLRNTGWIEFSVGDSRKQVRVVGLCDRIVMFPTHYVSFFKKGVNAQFIKFNQSGMSTYNIELANLEPRQVLSLDLSICRLPSHVPLFCDMRGSFVTNNDVLRKINREAVLYEVGAELTLAQHHLDAKPCVGVTKYTSIEEEYALNGFMYGFSKKGACGSLLVNRKTDKIIGMHASGDGTDGYSVVISREMLDAICNSLKKPLISQNDLPEVVTSVDGDMEAEVCEKVGYTASKMRLNVAVKTKIRKSPICGVLTQPNRFPAMLREHGEANPGYGPLSKAVAEANEPPIEFDPRLLDIAVRDVTNLFVAKAKPATVNPVQVRTLTDAVLGVEGVNFMPGIRMNTSPGYPFCALRPGSTKGSFIYDINYEKRSFVLDPLLEKKLEEDLAERRRGVVPPTIYACFGKDERLKPGKNMRLIEGVSLPELINCRAYFLDFMAAFTSANLDVGHAIGMNIFHRGAQKIVGKLHSLSDNILTGDYKKFGPRLQAAVVASIPSIVNTWYTHYCGNDDSANIVRETMYASLSTSYHIAGDLVFRQACGSPSGHPFTIQNNSIANLIYLRYIWLKVFQNTKYGNMRAFYKYFVGIVVGDDFIGSIHSSLLDEFNNKTMEEAFAEYKIVFTDATKDGTQRKSCSISEASFLKCTFRYDHELVSWVAGLEKSVIEDIPNWLREPCPDITSYLCDVADDVLRFSFLWGSDYFEENKKTLQATFNQRGIHWTPLNYDDLKTLKL
uniref:Genome polyprotein n=1 Tax=Picornavirales sp. TaxID=1955153 RepID=A0A6M3YNQ2_9VIRU|nr:MAG: polyprotein [Picornavirales sp.]